MASDLSSIIEQTITSTLSGSLGKESTLKSTNKLHPKDIENLQLTEIEANYEFDNITTSWKYIYPARTSSIIFNHMIGDPDAELAETVDNDMLDAMKEFTATISGTLTTTINGSDLEDLGKSTFTIGECQNIESSQIQEDDDIFKFHIDLEGIELDIFVAFDDLILPFVETILQSPQSEYKEEEPVIEEIEEEIINEDTPLDAEQQEEPSQAQSAEPETKNEEEKTTDNPPVENEKEEDKEKDSQAEELTDEEKKQKKLKLIVIVVAALLGLTIISGIVMFFLGVFDPPPPPKVEDNTTKIIKNKDNIEVVQYPNKKSSNFDQDSININRLNSKLEILMTSTPVATSEEKNTTSDNLIQEYKEFAKQNKEEPLHSMKQPEPIAKAEQPEQKIEENLIKPVYIKTRNIHYKIFKNAIINSTSKTARLNLCQLNDQTTTLYIGPFESTKTFEQFESQIKTLVNIQYEILELSQEEFNTTCNN